MIGQTIAHYRIIEKLGEGGMGVVYQARDLHLDRLVAIKLLPHDKTADPERKRRFVQEAKSASALNHPHIVTVHDVASDAGVDFIVMECVSGRTLGQAIGRKGLKLGDVLNYGAQIADALAAAHGAGIVHRDLKPGNVMVTERGVVKVLDFGLAKLTEVATECATTMTQKPETEEGTIVGTVAYMSPEQAEGKRVDARSDIFSFGAVLYEMATGRRAFSAETKLSTLSAILHQEPPPLEHAPPELEKIIARCLRKDPDRRIQHMVDVKIALEDLKEESDSGTLPAAAPRRPARVRPWAIAATAVTVLAVASIAFWWLSPPAALGAPVLMQLTTDAGLSTDPALSPDGTLLAYASDRSGDGNLDIWVRQIGGEPIRRTQDPADEREPTFSPDGKLIAFSSEGEGGGIYVVSALAGPPRKIAPEGRRPRFSPDGSQIAYWSGGIGGGAGFSSRDSCRIFVVAAALGRVPTRVRADFLGAAYPEWAPDGQHLVFLGNRDEKLPADESIDWWVTPLDQGPAIATGAFGATRKAGLTGPFLVYPSALVTPVWQLEGDSLIFPARSGDSRNLWRIGISSRTWKVTGAPERLTSSPAIEEGPAVASLAGGSVKIAFASLSENTDIWSLPLEADTGKVTGEPRQLTRDSAADFHPSLSADGRKMVWVSARSGHQEIWIKDLTTGKDAALTADRGDKYGPRFSPDALKVSFATHHAGKWDIYLMPAAGGTAEMICEDCGEATGWSPDGRYVTGNDIDGRLFLLEVASRRRIDLLVPRERWFAGGAFSPDGRWITFLDSGPPPRERIAPFQGETVAPESVWQSVLAELLEWSADGTLVYGASDHDGFDCSAAPGSGDEASRGHPAPDLSCAWGAADRSRCRRFWRAREDSVRFARTHGQHLDGGVEARVVGIMIGQTIAHYRILEKLGEGGMGVVYKARDTHLDRVVAIKFLPHDRTADAERKRRFVQEAKSASALNHPHIITVHDVASDDGVDFIVMECVSGRTLGQAIGRKGLKLNDVLNYGAQIADALAAAHGAGIVHRDLKPGNVMVTESGVVKVLDFGLAKLTETAAGEDAVTVSVMPKTEEGTIVGTVAYMSPEQAEGKSVDARSDIFSFGAVLYEMATGRRAFSAETKLSTLSAILHQEPPPLEHAPPELEKIIARCLRKDPDRRIQHMVDVKIALEDLKEESDSGTLPAAVPRRRARVLPWVIAALVAIVLAAASVAFWWLLPAAPLGAPVLTQLTRDTGLTIDPALSPDGKLLAYASDRSGKGNLDIWVRQVGGGDPMALTQDPADEREPAFSPDGTLIAYRSEKEGGGIYVVSALGGTPRLVAPARGPQRPRFSPDGSQIAYGSGYIGGGAGFSIRDALRIFVVASAGGAPRQLRADFLGAAYPEWAPDGQHLVFLGNRDEKLPADESIDWWVTPLDQGPAIATGAFGATRKEGLTGPFLVYPWALITAVWQAGGDSLIFAARSGDSRNLWRIGISSRTWKVTGLPERLTSSPAIEESPSVVSVARSSVKIAFASLGENTDIWSLPIEANSGKVTGEPHQLTRDSAADIHPSLSADGRRMVWISARSGNQEIWIKDLNTGEDAALTASRGDKYSPRFSPDALKVSFATHQAGKWDIYLMPAAGGAAEMICEDCGQATGWSPDGGYLIGNSLDGRLILVEVASHRRIDLVALGPRWFCCGAFSPDGRRIKFEGEDRVHLAPFQDETPLPESSWVSWDWSWSLWSPDGTLLYGPYRHDGFTCIGAQHLDRATMRPVGARFPVFHAHAARLNDHGGLIGRDKLVLGLVERMGNIWMAEWKGGW